MSTAAIRDNYSRVATTYDGKWADVLAVHARAVVMPFVLFHVPDLPAALAEVRRTLAPGGAFAAVTWFGHDPHPAYDVWVRVIDEHGAPPDPSPQMPSNDTTSDPGELSNRLGGRGVRGVRDHR